MATRGIFQRKKENLARSKEMQKKKEKDNSDSYISDEDNKNLNKNIDKLNDSSILEKSNVTNSEFDIKMMMKKIMKNIKKR